MASLTDALKRWVSMTTPEPFVLAPADDVDLYMLADGTAPLVGRHHIGAFVSDLLYKVLVCDLMLRVRIGVDRETQTPLLSVFGPFRFPDDYSPKTRQWWELYPCHVRDIPLIIQFLVAHPTTVLGPQLPLQGNLTAMYEERPIPLSFNMPTPHTLDITWPEEEVERLSTLHHESLHRGLS